MVLEFSRHIIEKYSYQISLKCVQCEPSCIMCTDERTDGQTKNMTKLTVTFRNFANSPKNKFNLRACAIFTKSSVS